MIVLKNVKSSHNIHKATRDPHKNKKKKLKPLEPHAKTKKLAMMVYKKNRGHYWAICTKLAKPHIRTNYNL